MVYAPGDSEAATYLPAASVVAVRSALVAVFRIVTVTPGTTAFCASVMVPSNVAVDCALTGAATNVRARARQTTFMRSTSCSVAFQPTPQPDVLGLYGFVLRLRRRKHESREECRRTGRRNLGDWICDPALPFLRGRSRGAPAAAEDG